MLLTVKDLRIAYPNTIDKWAVDGISFNINAGEKLGFVGESGCGKSTIGKAIMRLLPVGSNIEGEINFNDRSILSLNPQELRRFRGEDVALVFQDPMTRLNPLMTIGAHCLETLKAHEPNLTDSEAKQRVLDTLTAVKITSDRWNQYPHEFSGGMRQRVAIALALLLNPKMIIADEPTTSLDVRVSAEIMQELTRLCAERNLGLLLISHDLAMIGEYCDRLVVMYQGKAVEIGDTKTVFSNPQHEYTRSLLNAALHIQDEPENPIDKDPPQPILQLVNLQKHYIIEPSFLERILVRQSPKITKAVDNINLELYYGEIFGLVGESGCGKSTLSRTILQLIPATHGQVKFNGQELTTLSREEMRKKRKEIQMIFQDPNASLNPKMTVGEIIGDALIIQENITITEAKPRVLEMLDRVGLTPSTEYYHRYPKDLSGGQQQRIGIARALITKPKLVICDEPVSMLDAHIQTQVLDLMLELKKEFDLTYLFITHDLWLAKFLCDRIAVMHSGQIVEMGNTQEIFNNPQDSYTKELLSAAPLLTTIA